MSSKNSKPQQLHTEGFRGIGMDPQTPGFPRVADIANYHLMSDGSLKKRPGCQYLINASEPIRAHFVTQKNGLPAIYVLFKNCVQYYRTDTGKLTTVGYVYNDSGDALFFLYWGQLFLVTGSRFFAVTDSSLILVESYVPLLGKNWTNNRVGTIYEPMNLLNNMARISYVISDPPSIFLCAPYPLSEIHSVVKNGVTLSSDAYYLDQTNNSVNVPGLQAGDQVTVFVSFTPRYPRLTTALFHPRAYAPLVSSSQGQICLWGNVLPSTLFVSRWISEASLRQSQAFVSNSTPIYFPEGSELTVADSRSPLRSVIPYRNNLLLFTDTETWMASKSEDTPSGLSLCGVNSSLGCCSPKGAVLAGNDPITISSGTVLRWENAADGWSEATCLSAPIDRFMTLADYQLCELCYHTAADELWMRDPTHRCIWICRLSGGDWFRYYNVDTDCLVQLGTSMGFIKEGSLYMFQEGICQDQLSPDLARPIHASLIFFPSNLGSENKKTLCSLTLCGDPDGEETEVTFRGGDLPLPVRLTLPSAAGPRVLKGRCPSGRFLTAECLIHHRGAASPLLRSLTLEIK